jgi:putative ABC transport system substrate-binding protein
MSGSSAAASKSGRLPEKILNLSRTRWSAVLGVSAHNVQQIGGGMNNRRKLLIALGASAIAEPFGVFAQQQGKVWRVGFLGMRLSTASNPNASYDAFVQGMRELGYVEGKNLVIESRIADGKAERLPGLAAELVQLNVDVILAAGVQPTSAAQKATTTIPIVMGNSNDPVGSGFVASLARPGGNITGLSNLIGDLGPKHFEMLRSMTPKLSRVAILVNPTNSGHATILKTVQSAAQKSGVKILPVQARNPQEIESAFLTMARENAGAIIVANDLLFNQRRRQIAELAVKNRLASVAAVREYVEAGGLMSYGPNFVELYRRAATYVDKILKGANPGNIPVEQPTKFELFINRKTAKALGLAIPQSLLISANRVIE